MAEPTIAYLWEFEDGGRYTLDHLADFHEALDLKAETKRRTEPKK